MALILDNPQTGALVSELSRLTGETADEAIQQAVKARIERLSGSGREAYIARLMAITERVAAMPILDDRTPDEIMGYNDQGHFD